MGNYRTRTAGNFAGVERFNLCAVAYCRRGGAACYVVDAVSQTAAPFPAVAVVHCFRERINADCDESEGMKPGRKRDVQKVVRGGGLEPPRP